MYIPPLVPLVNTFREFRLITDTRNGVDRTSRSERDAMANAMQCNAMLACRDYNVDRRIEIVLSGGGRGEKRGKGLDESVGLSTIHLFRRYLKCFI